MSPIRQGALLKHNNMIVRSKIKLTKKVFKIFEINVFKYIDVDMCKIWFCVGYSCVTIHGSAGVISYPDMCFSQILCIHLKRFRHDFVFSSKIGSYVSFPLDGLDMGPYLHKGKYTHVCVQVCVCACDSVGDCVWVCLLNL